MTNIVLIVDDCRASRSVLNSIVDEFGLQSEHCDDGAEAIRYLAANAGAVAMVFLDIYMPQIDGISALGHLRGHYPNLPVVVVTGSGDADDEQSVMKLGSAGFISKPFSTEGIRNVIRGILGRVEMLVTVG